MRAPRPTGPAPRAAAWLAAVAMCLAGCGDMSPAPSPVAGADKDLCPAYCALAMAYCQAPVRLFGSQAECETGCAARPAGGSLGAGTGDTVACRLTYLMAEPHPGVVMCTYARLDNSPACR